MADDPQLVPVALEGDERRQLLDLVEEIQGRREGRALPPDQVPSVLLPYQIRWHEDLSPVRIAEKSRRIGFSWGCLAAESVLEAGSQRGTPGAMDQFYMGYNREMAAEYIGDCAFFARMFQAALSAPAFAPGVIDVEKFALIIQDERRDIIKYSVRLASGFVIESLSSNPHNWRGRQGHARIDEAAFHENLREVIKGAMAFLMWGGRVDIVSTHNGDENEFNLLCKKVAAGQLPYSPHKVTFDDALAQGFYRRVCLVRGIPHTPEGQEQYRADTYASYPNSEDADEELGVMPKRGSGTYIPRLLVERCWEAGIPVARLAKPVEFVLAPDRMAVVREWLDAEVLPILRAIPQDGRTVLGQDFGRDGDLSVIAVMRETAPGMWRTVIVVELRRIPFDCQQAILFGIIDALPHFKAGKLDARGNGQSHAEAAYQRYLDRIGCVKATAEWYALAFPKYKTALESRSIVLPLAEDIATDHRRVVLTAGRPTMDSGKDRGTDGEQRHGDSVIAFLLAWMAAIDDGDISYDYHGAPRHPPVAAADPHGWRDRPDSDFDDAAGLGRRAGW